MAAMTARMIRSYFSADGSRGFLRDVARPSVCSPSVGISTPEKIDAVGSSSKSRRGIAGRPASTHAVYQMDARWPMACAWRSLTESPSRAQSSV